MIDRQKTISKEITFKGKGLHTGNITAVKLKPAQQNEGIKFIRTDFSNECIIPVNYKNVLGVVRGTTIGIGNGIVYTVEHLLAALNGLGIDNLIIELNNNEPPVFDGSAGHFVKFLLDANIVEQSEPKNYVKINQSIKYSSEDSGNLTEISAYPSDDLKIDCKIIYDHPLVNTQHISLNITPQNFINEISMARTYCFDFEIESLKKMGFAKGGDPENAIIIGIDKVHNKEQLRYKDEIVRHKLLDLLGDIFLLGRPLKAHIIAVRCGHKHNINFIKKLGSLV